MKKLPLDIQYFSSGPEASATKECIYNEQGICSSVKVTISSNTNILKILDSNETDVTTEWGLTSGSTENGSTATKTFTSNTSIVLVAKLGTNSRNTENIDVNIDITEISEEKEQSFGYCKSKCKHPIYTKDDIDNMLNINRAVLINNNNIKVEVFRIGNICHLVGYSHSDFVTEDIICNFDIPTWAKPSKGLSSTKNEGSYGSCNLRVFNTTVGELSWFSITVASSLGHHYNCLTYYVE